MPIPQIPHTELNIENILSNIDVVFNAIGPKWIKRKLREAKRSEELNKARLDRRKHSYLYEKPLHPIIQWFLEANKWREVCLKTHKLELRESVVKLATLGMALEQARTQPNYDRLVNRLKNAAQFHSSAFEVEVAASYINKGWSVEFVEEGDEKTPDLKVTVENSRTFWVECKRRDELSGRDRLIHKFWLDLESSLLRTMGPAKLNCAVVIKSLNDPSVSQLEALRTLVLDSINSGGVGVLDVTAGKTTSVPDPTANFSLVVQKLAEPDQEIPTTSIGLNASEDFDRFTIIAEVKIDQSGNTYFRNPMIFAFKNSIISDIVTGILNDFKAAVAQLPKEGPGVIWIRIPDNSWNKNIEQAFKQAEKLIKNEISGTQNRRVNAVIIVTRIFQKLENDGSQGLAYKPLKMVIEHSNPRHSVSK